MKKIQHIYNKIAELSDLSGEPIPGTPLIEISGSGRIVIEHYSTVLIYTDTEIQVETKLNIICIEGSGLKLSCISKHYLIITGDLTQILFRKGGK